MTLVDAHNIVGTAFMYFALIIAIWALFHLVLQRAISSDFWGAVVIGEVLSVLQTIIGGILLIKGGMPARPIHFLYGAVALLTWPAVFTFTRGETGRREVLYWVLTSAFLFGIALRARATGTP